MSTQNCSTGDTQGFPLTISQSLYSQWPGVELSDVYKRIKKITIQNEYSVKWGAPTNATISVVKPTPQNSVLQVTGIDANSNGTTMTYGAATYNCSNVLSIVKEQHGFFSNDPSSSFEAILSFHITNKNSNPSSPDVILFCRPLTYSSRSSTPPMWAAIDRASSTSVSQNVIFDLSSIYAYNTSTLMPLITYQTCIPVKLLTSPSPTYGSLRVRVNVILQPLYLNPSSSDLTTTVTKYTLPTNPVGLFSISSLTTPKLQFKNGGSSSDGFPTTTTDNLKFLLPTTRLSDLDTILNTIQVQVPEALLGKSLNDIATASPPPAASPKNKAYKCYTVDPTKDIVDGQIMIDPTTGESLVDTTLDSENSPFNLSISGEPIQTGIMPGDVEAALSVTAVVIGTIGLVVYALYIYFLGKNISLDQTPISTFEKYTPLAAHTSIFLGLVLGLVAFSLLVEQGAVKGTDADPIVIQGKINTSNAAVRANLEKTKANLESQKQLQLQVAGGFAVVALLLILLPITAFFLVTPPFIIGVFFLFLTFTATSLTYTKITG